MAGIANTQRLLNPCPITKAADSNEFAVDCLFFGKNYCTSEYNGGRNAAYGIPRSILIATNTGKDFVTPEIKVSMLQIAQEMTIIFFLFAVSDTFPQNTPNVVYEKANPAPARSP